MQKILLLFLGIFSIINIAIGQHLDYDHSSKWFLGINTGATWSCTDVKNETNAGWGLTLGRSYNWNYGNRVSFDIRARYLQGNWYGQDYDTTNLSNYMGNSLTYFKDSGNMVVNNFDSDVHRLALELVLHANRLVDRTKFDPYIFGGIGVTWKRTWGDLGTDTNFYNYPGLLSGGSLENSIPATLDGVYESILDGSTIDKYTAKWMPSLGIGLGYQVGPRFSIGIEHKTTFTGTDNFDGFESTAIRSKNDWYHYTSGYLQFRFKGHEKQPKEDNTNSNNNINNFTTNCEVPTIVIKDKVINTTQNSFNLIAQTTQINNQNQISITAENGNPLVFSFNNSSRQITSLLSLKPGLNTFIIRVQNECGSATQTLQITYNDCKTPIVTLTSPLGNQTQTVQQSTLTISALIENANSTGIILWINGIQYNSFLFNPTNHVLQSNITLQPGKNTIKIEASNPCGSSFAAGEIIYDNCITPQMNLISPSASGTTVSNASQKVSIVTLGFFQKTDFNILINGQGVSNYTWVNNLLEFSVNLNPGNNTITVNGTNRCGSESIVLSINYQQCQAPVISLLNPSIPNNTLTNPNYRFKFKVQSQSTISLLVNNQSVTNFTFNATTGIGEYPMVLLPGNNSITLTATNSCGVDIETLSLFYDNCISPTVQIGSLGGITNNATYTFSANCTNLTNSQGVQLTLNGITIPFTFINGQITSITNLNPGANIFSIKVTNACGTQTKTLNINYDNCIAPQVNLIQPVASGITVNQTNYTVQCNVSQITNPTGITFKLNGIAKPFQLSNGVLTASVNLVSGINNFIITAINSCGSDSESFTITYNQCMVPSVVLNNPNQLNTTSSQSTFNISSSVLNCTSLSQINILQNGVNVPFTFTNGLIGLTASLTPGNNLFQITATNTCGKDVAIFTIFYDNCIAPSLSLQSPNPIPVNVTNSSLSFSASTQNITNSNQISLMVNGNASPFQFSNSTINATIQLQSGANAIVLTATNSCGNDIKSTIINYQPCKSPTVNIIAPATSGLTVNTDNYSFSANVENITSSSEVSITLNGSQVNNFQLNNSTISAPLTLSNGLNTVVIRVNNGCGTDQQICTINYSNCNSPSVIISNSNGTTVTNSSYTFSASIQNMNSSQGISLMVNGQITPFNFSNNLLTANCTLNPGMNTLLISVTNACGTDTKSIQTNYLNCTIPVVTISNNSGTTQTNQVFNLMANVQNVNTQQISLQLNGTPISNFNLNGNSLTANLTLQAGLNQITITVQNACGMDNANTSVTYDNCIQPSIQISNTNNETVTQGLYNFSANVSNMPTIQGIQLKINGNIVSNFNYTNGQISATLSLADNDNIIELSVVNSCGQDLETLSVYYDHCVPPTITVTSSLQSSDGNYIYMATLTNVDNTEGFLLTLNGVPQTYQVVNGVLSSNTILTQGANTFVLQISNNCGTDSETSIVNFSSCVTPNIQINTPLSSGSSTANSSVQLLVDFIGYDANTIVQITKNGNLVSGYSINNGSIQQTVNLSYGQTTFVISASNACGTDTETYIINRCKAPTLAMIAPNITNTNVSLSSYLITIDAQNATSIQQISLSQNGSLVQSIALNGSILTAPITLQPGTNNFIVNVATDCGSDQLSFQINYVVSNPNNNGGSIVPNNQGEGFGNGNNGNTNTTGGNHSPSNPSGGNKPNPNSGGNTQIQQPTQPAPTHTNKPNPTTPTNTGGNTNATQAKPTTITNPNPTPQAPTKVDTTKTTKPTTTTSKPAPTNNPQKPAQPVPNPTKTNEPPSAPKGSNEKEGTQTNNGKGGGK